jgi:hypothetical protein
MITAPCYSGNSGSPIVDKNGDIVGIYTFVMVKNYTVTGVLTGVDVNLECFGGGANLNTLQSTIQVLLNSVNNKSKKYIGLPFLFLILLLYTIVTICLHILIKV